MNDRRPSSLWLCLIQRAFIVASTIAVMTWRNLDALKVVRLDDARMLNDALINGIDSIWHPYAGYLQIAPRTICLMIAQLPPHFFAATLAFSSYAAWLMSFWCVTYCVVTRTRNSAYWWTIVLLAGLPPFAIPIVGYFNHLQEPAFIAVTAIIATPGVFQTTRKTCVVGALILIFGVSSPLIIMTFIQLLFVADPRFIVSAQSPRHLITLMVTTSTAFIQVLIGFTQHDRNLTWSVTRIVEGHAFIAVSFLPMSLRNKYFSEIGFDRTTIQFLGAVTLVVVMITIIKLLLHLSRGTVVQFELQLLWLSILSASFCVSVSDSYHSGYVVPLYVATLIFSLVRTGKGERLVQKLSAVVLGLLLAGSLQSSFNRNLDDNFFGPNNLLASLTHWDASIRQAKSDCRNSEQTVGIPTDSTLSISVILIQCDRLR